MQVIEELHADQQTSEIPIILNSAAHMAMADIQKADGFLAKPFPESLLNEMVQRVLQKRTGKCGATAGQTASAKPGSATRGGGTK